MAEDVVLGRRRLRERYTLTSTVECCEQRAATVWTAAQRSESGSAQAGRRQRQTVRCGRVAKEGCAVKPPGERGADGRARDWRAGRGVRAGCAVVWSRSAAGRGARARRGRARGEWSGGGRGGRKRCRMQVVAAVVGRRADQQAEDGGTRRDEARRANHGGQTTDRQAGRQAGRQTQARARDGEWSQLRQGEKARQAETQRRREAGQAEAGGGRPWGWQRRMADGGRKLGVLGWRWGADGRVSPTKDTRPRANGAPRRLPEPVRASRPSTQVADSLARLAR